MNAQGRAGHQKLTRKRSDEWSGHQCDLSPHPGVLKDMTPSDAEIIHQVRQGDSEAFGVLVDRHSARLSRYALHLLGNRADAEEAVQEALVRAFRSLARYEEREQFGAWLLRILVNRYRTLASRRRDFEPLETASLAWHPCVRRAAEHARLSSERVSANG